MQVQFRTIQDIPVKAYFVSSAALSCAQYPQAGQALELAERYEAFTGALGQIACIRDYQSGSAAVFVGLGDAVTPEALRRGTDRLMVWANRQRVTQLGIAAGHLREEGLRSVAEAAVMAVYQYTEYLTVQPVHSLEQVVIETEENLLAAGEEGAALGQTVNVARDLVNELADVLTPAELARRCQALGERWGFSVEVLDRSACEDLGMGLFLAVAQGSALEPRFIVMRWNGGKPEEPPIALVGKGITYDSGGLAIKKSSMESMRFDMNGAAAVIGAMCAIARQKLPRNVVAAVAACENMVDAHSYRNGAVLRSMSGQTVFVRNTDAEGRLTMADAMTYCVRTFHPSELLEVAGLTGSVCSFFGSVCAAALATDPSIFDRVAGLSDITGEKYAQMPYFQEYRQQLKSPYADLDNAPAGGAGGILAGFFLESFREGTPFLHVDFGAMPFTGKASDGQPEGGTGFGVKTLYHYVKRRCRT